MAWLKNFLNGLVSPTVTPKNSAIGAGDISLTDSLIISAVIAEVTSGSDSTLLDKATYVAMPHVIRAVAGASAQKNFVVGESAN